MMMIMIHADPHEVGKKQITQSKSFQEFNLPTQSAKPNIFQQGFLSKHVSTRLTKSNLNPKKRGVYWYGERKPKILCFSTTK